MKNMITYRQDFSILQNGKVVYFDNACQTLRPNSVIKAMNQYYEEFPACAGRSMHHLAAKVTQKSDLLKIDQINNTKSNSVVPKDCKPMFVNNIDEQSYSNPG